uniref:Uncharacterized protein n=1 Tax=Megaselia scalaris TaxID=36166 RepID=T1GS26_MEGSC
MYSHVWELVKRTQLLEEAFNGPMERQVLNSPSFARKNLIDATSSTQQAATATTTTGIPLSPRVSRRQIQNKASPGFFL